MATVRHKKPENWLSAIGRNGQGIETTTKLSPGDRLTEAMLMGMRLREGLDLSRHFDAENPGLTQSLNQRALVTLEAQGLIARNGPRLRATDRGLPVLNAILAALLIDPA
jgi:oxygen-independent coproporphyrinogen-3 oxidase